MPGEARAFRGKMITGMARPKSAAGPHPTTVLLRLSVFLGATAGFTLGLTLLWAVALQRAGDLPWAALVQAHGQVQIVGFVGLFVLGTAAQLLPGFLSRPLTHQQAITRGGYLIASALLLRAVAQPLDPSAARAAGLWLSALAEAGGVGLCLFSYASLVRQTIQPPDLWRYLALTGFGFLALSVALNILAVAFLAAGQSVVPEAVDAALVHLELAGFVVFLTFAVSRKILPRFLLLQTPNDGRIRLGAACYLLGVISIAVGWLLGALWPASAVGGDLRIVGAWPQLIGVLLYLDGLNLYRAPVRPSGAPNVTDPARRWIRVAFAWLAIANALTTLWATRALLGGPAPSFFEITAERHALAQGFILTLIIAYASRILPGYSAWAIQRPRIIETIVALVTAGAALRVIGEVVASWPASAGEAIAGVGGTLGVAGFLLFAAFLAKMIGHAPRATGKTPTAVSQ